MKRKRRNDENGQRVSVRRRKEEGGGRMDFLRRERSALAFSVLPRSPMRAARDC